MNRLNHKTLICLFVFLGSFGLLRGQYLVWAGHIGGNSEDLITAIKLDSEGNIYATGYFEGPADLDPGPEMDIRQSESYDFFVIKLNSFGELIWARHFGGSSYDAAFDIGLDEMANVYVTGLFQQTIDFDPGPGVFALTSNGSEDVFILKLDTDGNFIWAKSIGGASWDQGLSLAVEPSGNIFVTGVFNGLIDLNPGPGSLFKEAVYNEDIFVLAMQSQGNFSWGITIGEEMNPVFPYAVDLPNHLGVKGLDIATSVNQSLYLTGYYNNNLELNPQSAGPELLTYFGQESFLIKMNTNGTLIWNQRFQGPGHQKGLAVSVDSQENVYSVGYYTHTSDFQPGGGEYILTSSGQEDIYMSCLSPNKQFVWAYSMGGSNTDAGHDIALTQNDELYITGSFSIKANLDPANLSSFILSPLEVDDIFIVKTDHEGQLKWAISLGGPYKDCGLALAADEEGNVYTAGYFNDIANFGTSDSPKYIVSNGFSDGFITKHSSVPQSNYAKAPVESKIAVFPNPFNTVLNIHFLPYNSEQAIFIIRNSDGRILHEIHGQIGENQVSLNMEDLSVGIYFLEVIQPSGAKIVKVAKL